MGVSELPLPQLLALVFGFAFAFVLCCGALWLECVPEEFAPALEAGAGCEEARAC